MILDIKKHSSDQVAISALFFLVLCIRSPEVLADSDDVFNAVVGTSYYHDSNLFRLPSGAQPGGSGAERWDNITRTNLGFKINKYYSLQNFKVDYTHIDTKYDNAKFLDFKANNYKAAWLWSLTPSLKGNLSSEKIVDLVPFLDYRVTNAQNIRTTDIQIFDFDWSPHNKWHLLGAYTKLDVTNSQTFLPETSFKLDAIEGGVKYSFPSQSFIAFKVKTRNGENQTTNFASLVGKGFTEDEEELSAFWQVTGKSKISSNISHLRRTDDTFSIRDFSGYSGGINYAWDATSKLRLVVDLSRKLASFQDFSSSYTVADTLSVLPSWAVTSKITVRANALISKRMFKGGQPIFNPTEREDDSLSYGVGVDWSPRSVIRVGISLQHDERDSNFANRDFSANSATISGQLIF